MLLASFTMNPDGTDSGYSVSSVTCNSTAMNQLGFRHENDQTAGFMGAYALLNPPIGIVTITVTLSGVADVMVGGSISYMNVDQLNGLGTPVVQVGDSSGVVNPGEALITVANNTSGNVIVGFLGAGSGNLDSVSPGTSYIENNDNGDAAGGCFSLQTSPATGSSVTLEWDNFYDWWAGVAVEVKGVSGAQITQKLTMVGIV